MFGEKFVGTSLITRRACGAPSDSDRATRRDYSCNATHRERNAAATRREPNGHRRQVHLSMVCVWLDLHLNFEKEQS